MYGAVWIFSIPLRTSPKPASWRRGKIYVYSPKRCRALRLSEAHAKRAVAVRKNRAALFACGMTKNISNEFQKEIRLKIFQNKEPRFSRVNEAHGESRAIAPRKVKGRVPTGDSSATLTCIRFYSASFFAFLAFFASFLAARAASSLAFFSASFAAAFSCIFFRASARSASAFSRAA